MIGLGRMPRSGGKYENFIGSGRIRVCSVHGLGAEEVVGNLGQLLWMVAGGLPSPDRRGNVAVYRGDGRGGLLVF